jgi:hypothetical protein
MVTPTPIAAATAAAMMTRFKCSRAFSGR